MSYSEEFRDILRIVGRGRKLQRDLTTEEAERAMYGLLSDSISEAQIGAFLITMRVKEETVEEIAGFLRGAKAIMRPFPCPQVQGLVDFGLPYDGKEKHLQTGVVACMVLAAAGIPVLLHGLDDIPAKKGVGVLNLLRAWGYPADAEPEAVKTSIEETKFGALNLAHIFPEWARFTSLRSHFGLRTLLNTVEKFLNPADAPHHINGFYHGSYLLRMADAMPAHQINWIIQGEEGGIDFRLGKKTNVYKPDGEEMVKLVIDAATFGFADVHPLEAPKDPAYHAERLWQVLEGIPSPAFDQVVFTAATLLWMLEAVPSIPLGIETAQKLLAEGQVKAVLEHHKMAQLVS